MHAVQPTHRRVEIDALKGLAMLAVLAQHGLSSATNDDLGADYWIRQAVPVFMVLMGFNLYRVVRGGDGPLDLRGLVGRAYWVSRARRLVLPFLVAWVVSLVVGAVAGGLHFGPLTLLGVLPLTGPGNYFVTMALTAPFLLPLVAWGWSRSPIATTAVLVGVDVVFELAYGAWSPGSSALGYVYLAAILRFAAALALGLALAQRADRVRLPLLVAAAAVSVGYLVALNAAPESFDFLIRGYGEVTNLATIGLTALVVHGGLQLLARPAALRLERPVAAVGRASFHVFLVQVVLYGAVPTASVGGFVLTAVVACALGYGFFRAETWALRRYDARRAGPSSTTAQRSRRPALADRRA